MPSTTDLIGACELHGKVCTDRARFHSALARLGLTDMNSEEELGLLFGLRYANHTNDYNERRRATTQKQLVKISNPVFIYEVRQIHDKIISKQLSEDIQQYIQVKEALSEIVSYQQNKSRKINICDEVHTDVRKVLVEHGKDAADWIGMYFSKSSNVVVSAPDSFFAMLHEWTFDPCEKAL
jgi:hypothetical protein